MKCVLRLTELSFHLMRSVFHLTELPFHLMRFVFRLTELPFHLMKYVLRLTKLYFHLMKSVLRLMELTFRLMGLPTKHCESTKFTNIPVLPLFPISLVPYFLPYQLFNFLSPASYFVLPTSYLLPSIPANHSSPPWPVHLF